LHSLLCTPCTPDCASAVSHNSFKPEITRWTVLGPNGYYPLLMRYIAGRPSLCQKKWPKIDHVAQFVVIEEGEPGLARSPTLPSPNPIPTRGIAHFRPKAIPRVPFVVSLCWMRSSNPRKTHMYSSGWNHASAVISNQKSPLGCLSVVAYCRGN
jgi:hypothetical protein